MIRSNDKNGDCSELIGKKWCASIGEPWDFVSEHGKNALSGIVTQAATVDERYRFLSSVSPFFCNEHKIDTVLLSYRYTRAKQGFLLGEVFCFSFMKDGSAIGFDVLSDGTSFDKVSWLIGSIVTVE